MKDLQSKIENAISKDKLLHFTFAMLMSLSALFSVWLLLLPIIAGVVKEIIDKYIRETGFDVKDMFATWFGAVPVAIVIIIQQIT